ncbi:MAG: GAF domain-containing protein, partial [Chloroflexaceae bacterium]|nr:GAF domain-containing protein [Chloroflexaceae bacterium]
PDALDPLNGAGPWYALAAPIAYNGERRAVLLVGGIRRDPTLIDIDLSTLAHFAVQVSATLQIAGLLDHEQQMLGRMTVLGQLSRFCQETRDEDQILHAFLTAVTANYGLRFNRAVAFLLNERKDLLVARMAIGHLTPQQAARDRVEHEVGSFQIYLDMLRRGVLPFTPLLERVHRMAIPITQHEPDALLTVLLESRALNLEAADLGELLPEQVLTALQATGPTAIAPLAASGEVQGLVLVDNAFTQAPISDDDCEALLAFAHTTAVALENLRLVRDHEAARRCLGGLLAASGAPPDPGADPHEILRSAVARVREVTGAMWVSIVLINDQEEVGLAISTRDGSFSAQSMIREHGVSKEVWRSGAPQVFEHTELHRERLQPVIFRRGVAAAACLPFMLGERRLGVLWLHWAAARRCPAAEMEALRLYLHQTAIAYDNAQRIRTLEQIRRAAEAVATAPNWQAVLEQIARHGCDLLRGSAAIVWACDPADGQIAPERSVSWNLDAGIWQAIRQYPPRGVGPVQRALAEGWSAINNLGETASADASGMNRLIERTESRACQMVRIGASGAVRGVLMVLYNRAQRFTWDDRETAGLFANYAALVLSQADLLESLQLANQRLDAAQTTVRLAVNASALENIGRALRSLVAGTRRLLAADAVVLYACDPEQRALTLPPVTEGVADERHVAHKPRVLRDSLVAEVMRRQGVWIVEEAGVDPRFSISNFVRREGIVACIASPLAYGGRCVGAMFASYRQPHRFSEEEIGHFALLADQAAIVIRNHQLYHEHQRRIFTLEAIQRAGQAVTGAVVRDALGRSPLGLTLNRIVEQSLLLISPEVRDRSFSHLAMVEGSRLRFTAACPAERLEGLRQRIGDLELSSARCGITGRAVRLQRTVRVDNVHADPDYICYDPAVTSELAVPIMLGQRVIGVINLEHPNESAFDAEDERALQALADYAAIAIQNARLYACLETVEDIGRNVAMSTSMDTLLADLCRHLQQTMFPACLVRILLYDRDAEQPCLIANPAWSSGEMTGDITTRASGEGICGYVAERRVVVLRNDLHDSEAEPAPAEAEGQGFPARAELCVPIVWGETTLGVLDVQSPCREAFSHDDAQVLEIVAAQIAAALHHARYIESLHSMRGIVGGRASLEWMRTVVNLWRHEIEDYAQNIRNEVRMVALKPSAVSYEQWIETRLGQIDVNARRILDRSLTPALRADEGVAEVRLDDLIRRRVRELWLQERYTATVPMPLLELQARAVVRVNPELLRIAIEGLVRNAVEAMASVPTPSLRIVTERLGASVRVLIQDSGPGIPPEIRSVLFKEQVRRPHGERLRGTGLLMVRAIIEAYSGRVDVLETGAEGTTMFVELPVETWVT